MIIIGLSDIHGSVPILEKMGDILADADVVLLVGDITHFGREAETRLVLTPVMQRAQKVLAVAGNCDYRGVDTYLDAENVNLHGKGEVFNGIGFVGLGRSLITPFNTPSELTEGEIDHYLNMGHSQIPPDIPMVLVSHQPPIQTKCDRLTSGKHVGSVAVRTYIQTHQPVLCFTGHIHESRGIDKIGSTHIINPGKLRAGYYAFAEIGTRVENIAIKQF